MIIPRVKKAAIAAAVLLLITLLANTAFGRDEDSSDFHAAHTSSIGVKIVERSRNCSCCTKHTSQIVDAATVEETLSDIAPGDTVVLSYKIINSGCLDVLLNGVYITVDDQQLNDCINLTWTVTKYQDNKPVNTIRNASPGKSLSSVSRSNNVSHESIVLEHDSSRSDYCILELEITYDDNSPQLSETAETVFTITPSFIQN